MLRMLDATQSKSETTNERDSISFEGLVEQAMQGNRAAVDTLLAQYSHLIAREVRTQRRFESLRARVDVEDITQSVWRCFFDALRQGEVAFRDSSDLAAYLASVTRKRIASQLRKHLAHKRDVRRTIHSTDFEIASHKRESPSHSISIMEILKQVMYLMTPEERCIAIRRSEGSTWEEIAFEMGVNPDAIRKRHTRMAARLLSAIEESDGTK